VINSPHPLHSVDILPDEADELVPILPELVLTKGPPPMAAGGSTFTNGVYVGPTESVISGPIQPPGFIWVDGGGGGHGGHIGRPPISTGLS